MKKAYVVLRQDQVGEHYEAVFSESELAKQFARESSKEDVHGGTYLMLTQTIDSPSPKKYYEEIEDIVLEQ